ncbi:MAG: bifunctional helix-turn-helix domain-containing protein/methylated-DNA--[protein]-cysteine S-methyltransferase [Rhodobacter sp.]|nr:bifunctional helix-turn-helix domain-containing protein/methylated-DNA--[protein]-cysteine S-methyltransferase [Rhodobacter sp.]
MAEPISERAYHYSTIRRAIDLIDSHGGKTLTLDELSREMRMSSAHFQRIFSRWVGVSPKRYQQYLMLGHARDMLRNRFTTLDTAAELGLSGSGRLHDLFMTWEAMTPGEYARHCAGLEISWGWFDSPFGPAHVMGTANGICGMAFASESGKSRTHDDLRRRWPGAVFTENPDCLRAWVRCAFGENDRQDESVPLHVIGAPFQIKVWEALLRIPSGYVTTYSEIARSIDSPRASRAAGTAIGRNPISWLIPCHRALRKSGELGGYHWGLPVKRAILAYEAARADPVDRTTP